MDVQTPLWFLLVLAIAPALVTALAMLYTNKLSNDARSRDLKAQLDQERLLRTKEWGREFRSQLVQQLNDAAIAWLVALQRWERLDTDDLEWPLDMEFSEALARSYFLYDPAVMEAFGRVRDSLQRYENALRDRGNRRMITQAMNEARAETLSALRFLARLEESFIMGYTSQP